MKRLLQIVVIIIAAAFILFGRGTMMIDSTNIGRIVGIGSQIFGVLFAWALLFHWPPVSFEVPNYGKHRKSLMWLYFILGVMYLVSFLIIYVLLNSDELGQYIIGSPVVGSILFVLLIFSAGAFTVTYGLSKDRYWSRQLAKIVAIAASFAVWPVGLMLSLYTWWVLRGPSDDRAHDSTPLDLLTIMEGAHPPPFSATNAPHDPAKQETRGGDNKLGGGLNTNGHHKRGNPTEPNFYSDVLILEKRADENKKAELILEYSNEARKNFDRLKYLPKAFAQTFIEKLEEFPAQDTGKLSDRLIAAHKAEIRSSQQEKLNQAQAQARALGPEAEREFCSVVTLLGDKIDVSEVLVKLREKFRRTLAQSPSPQIQYPGWHTPALIAGFMIIFFLALLLLHNGET